MFLIRPINSIVDGPNFLFIETYLWTVDILNKTGVQRILKI